MTQSLTKLADELWPLLAARMKAGSRSSRGTTSIAGAAPSPHDLDSTHHSGTLSWVKVSKTGSSLADLASRAHSSLTGIGANDHHNQSHVLATTSGLGGDHSVSGLTAGYMLRASGATTAAFAAIQDGDLPATVVRTSRVINAGAGLTGGGALSADLTINVGAGAGITVNANDVALTAPGTLSATTTNSATGNHTHAITGSSNPGAAASILESDGSGFLTLVKLTTSSQLVTPLITNSAGDLNIDSVGDIVLDPAGQKVLPGSTITDDLGIYNRKWRTIYAAELYVETLVAQYVMATIGGRVMVAPTTKLIADAASGATTIDVEFNNLHGASGGKYIYLSSAPGGVAQVEAMLTGGAPTAITGGWRYSVTRNLDGSGANNWVAGDAVVSLGRDAGEGYIDLTSTSTIHSHIGPTITTYARTGSGSWNSVVPTTAMGNLDSFVDYSATEFGFAFGNNLTLTPTTGFKGGTLDRTNGVRLFNVDLELYDSGTLVTELNNIDGLKFRSGDFASRKITWWNATPVRLMQLAMISDTYFYGGLTTPAGQNARIEFIAQGGSGVDDASLQLYSASVAPEAVLKVGDHAIHLNNVSGPRYRISATYYKIWNETNDGSGSGLDADLLDGNQASAFALLTGANFSIIAGTSVKIGTGTIYGVDVSVDTSGGWARNYTFRNTIAGATMRAGMGCFGGPTGPSRLYMVFRDSDENLYSSILGINIRESGNVGIGTSSPTDALDIAASTFRLQNTKTPASAGATGTKGQIGWDTGYIYVCTATNTWKRAALATW